MGASPNFGLFSSFASNLVVPSKLSSLLVPSSEKNQAGEDDLSGRGSSVFPKSISRECEGGVRTKTPPMKKWRQISRQFPPCNIH